MLQRPDRDALRPTVLRMAERRALERSMSGSGAGLKGLTGGGHDLEGGGIFDLIKEYGSKFLNWLTGSQANELTKLGITDRKSLKEWARKNHPDKGGDEEIFKRIVNEARKAGFRIGSGRGGGEHTWDAFLNDVKTKVLPEATGVYNVLKKRIADSKLPLSERGKGRVLRGAGQWQDELKYVFAEVEELLEAELEKYDETSEEYSLIQPLIEENTENAETALKAVQNKAKGDFKGKQQVVQDYLDQANLLLRSCGVRRRVVMPTDTKKIGTASYQRVVEAPAREGRSASASEGRSASASEGRSASASASAPTLAELGITDKKSFLIWARKNHPDRGGDTAVFQRVLEQAQKAGFKVGSGKLKRAGIKY